MVSDPEEYYTAENDVTDHTGWARYTAIEILDELHPVSMPLRQWQDV